MKGGSGLFLAGLFAPPHFRGGGNRDCEGVRRCFLCFFNQTPGRDTCYGSSKYPRNPLRYDQADERTSTPFEPGIGMNLSST